VPWEGRAVDLLVVPDTRHALHELGGAPFTGIALTNSPDQVHLCTATSAILASRLPVMAPLCVKRGHSRPG